MVKKSIVLAVLAGMVLAAGVLWTSMNTSGASSTTAIIWDASQHWDAFSTSLANRHTWVQVPYGTTAYTFNGDTVLENKFFYISFNANSQDDLHVKRDDYTLWKNIFYRCYYPGAIVVGGVKKYAGSTAHIAILKNTSDEVMVQHTGARYPIVTTYRILKDKPWVEVRPVSNAHMLGIHGKVRVALAVVEGGSDYVIDSLRDPDDLYVPPEGRLVICFFESVQNAFMWVLTFPSFQRANTYFNCDSGPYGDTMWCDPGTRGGLTIPRKWDGCITATYSRFGNQTEPVVEGALAYWDNWYREHHNRPIIAGETYTSPWNPPYPGRWRMTVRIAEDHYDQGFEYDGVTEFPAQYFTKDVYDGNFTFTSPIDGWLDYIIMYMYDRTEETPAEILTPMDQYRWTIRQEGYAEPVGRHIFYNNSSFDGDDPAAGPGDDAAIATDKKALLPGTRTATFANYTSYSRGINGVMVDIADMPGTPSLTHFTFKVGNDNSPNGWAAAPAPTSITIRAGAGVDGSDRVTIIWPDNAIQKQWLQVTVKATAATGLASPDMFYFGNAVGDSGNSPIDTKVDTTDEINARLDPHKHNLNPAGIENHHDYNRDGAANTTDEIISRLNNTTLLNDLNLITTP